MDTIYNSIGYLGFYDDAFRLSSALTRSKDIMREQYAWREIQTEPFLHCTETAGVTPVATLKDLTERCGAIVGDGTDGERAAVLAASTIRSRAVYIDFTRALPAEKFRRAKQFRDAGAFYADAAYVGDGSLLPDGVHILLSGDGATLAAKYFNRLILPVIVPGEAGAATAAALLRSVPEGALCEVLPLVEAFRRECVPEEEGGLVPDVPENEGVRNAIYRSAQMTDAIWTPCRPFPKVTGLTTTEDFAAGIPVRGLPYSSARMREKFIGTNLSIEAFFSAVDDPDSVLYTRDIRADGNAAAYYGTVCSVFVGYALALGTRVPTRLWPKIPGMRLVTPANADNLRLADTLLSRTHVAMVTGIERDASGRVRRVTVSESTHPRCIRTTFRAEAFETYFFAFAGFRIFRYDRIQDVPYEPCSYVPPSGETNLPKQDPPALFLNFGNGVNCAKGEKLEFSVCEDGWETLTISRTGGTAERIPLTGRKEKIERAFEHCGEYTALCERCEEKSAPVRFAVVSAEVAVDCERYRPGEPICVTAFSEGGAMPESAFLVHDRVVDGHVRETQFIHWFTEAEQRAGRAVFFYDVPDTYLLKVFFRNVYGVYASNYARFEIAL